MKTPKGEGSLAYKQIIQREVDELAKKSGERPKDISQMSLDKARKYYQDARKETFKDRGRPA